MTKVRITNRNNTVFNSERIVDLETLVQQRDTAYQAFCEYLEQYGGADEDTIACEEEYMALERLIDEAELA